MSRRSDTTNLVDTVTVTADSSVVTADREWVGL